MELIKILTGILYLIGPVILIGILIYVLDKDISSRQ